MTTTVTLTDSEAATVRAAHEIAIDFWQDVQDKSMPGTPSLAIAREQEMGHRSMLERITSECGV